MPGGDEIIAVGAFGYGNDAGGDQALGVDLVELVLRCTRQRHGRVHVPLRADGQERGDGARTYVHVDGMAEPIVASRSERAIMADVEAALSEAAGMPRKRGAKGQGSLI